MQIKLKTIGDRIVVYAGSKPAGSHQGITMKAGLHAEAAKLVRRATRMSTTAATDHQPGSSNLGFSPLLRAPITGVVIPDECQSMPIPLRMPGTRTDRSDG